MRTPSQVPKSSVESLRGIEAMEVLIRRLPVEIKWIGLTEEQIRTEVKSKLRLAGIKVLSRKECLKIKWSPSLCVDIYCASDHKEYWIACNMRVEFNQAVMLNRNTNMRTIATTWSDQYTGVGGKDSILPGVQLLLYQLIDCFVNDYLSVNPKKLKLLLRARLAGLYGCVPRS
jgi:hypothetical protein